MQKKKRGKRLVSRGVSNLSRGFASRRTKEDDFVPDGNPKIIHWSTGPAIAECGAFYKVAAFGCIVDSSITCPKCLALWRRAGVSGWEAGKR